MKFSEVFTSKDNIQLDKKTLVILRWIANVGQFLTISIVFFIFKFELNFFTDELLNFYATFVFLFNFISPNKLFWLELVIKTGTIFPSISFSPLNITGVIYFVLPKNLF